MHRASRPVRLAVVIIAALLFVVAGAGTLAVADDYLTREILPAGSVVAGIDVSGLSRDAATDLVRTQVADPLAEPVTVTFEGRTFTLDPATVIAVDVTGMVETAFAPEESASLVRRVADRVTGVPSGDSSDVIVSVDEAALVAWVETIASSVDTPALDATTTVVANELVLTPSAVGVTVDVAASAEVIEAALVSGQKSAALEVSYAQPQITEDHLGPEIIVDISQRKLYLYVGGVLEKTYGVAVGTASYPTPTGDFEIVLKRYLPTWSNPGSAWAVDMPATIPPGPDNPLGTRALNLNISGIRIHGTSKDYSIGTAASHGCMRMHRWDIEDLYDRVEVGTKVHIVRYVVRNACDCPRQHVPSATRSLASAGVAARPRRMERVLQRLPQVVGQRLAGTCERPPGNSQEERARYRKTRALDGANGADLESTSGNMGADDRQTHPALNGGNNGFVRAEFHRDAQGARIHSGTPDRVLGYRARARARLANHKRLAQQIRKRGNAHARNRMPGGTDEHQLVGTEPLEAHSRPCHLHSGHAEVRVTRLDTRNDVSTVVDAKGDSNARVLGEKAAEEAGQHVLAGGCARGKGERAGDGARERLYALSGVIDFRQDGPGMREERRAGFSERDAAVLAVQEHRAAIGLKGLDLHRDRRLRESEYACGLGERTVIDNAHERPQLAQIHLRSLRSGCPHPSAPRSLCASRAVCHTD